MAESVTNAYQALERIDEAVQLYRGRLRGHRAISAERNLGIALALVGDRSAAALAFRRSERLARPGSEEQILTLAARLGALGEDEQVRDRLKTARKATSLTGLAKRLVELWATRRPQPVPLAFEDPHLKS